jgi:trimeric autotransporter adhesin
MLHTRWVSVCAVAIVLSISPNLRAQKPVASRIVAPLDESRLTTLPGGVSMHARAEFDLGRASASTQMNSVRLVLSRSLQQEAALERFMAEQLDPHSPNFRKWLTPDQFGKLYGPSDSDIQTLVTWLQSRGFTVQPVPAGRVSIAFSGSVSQIESAFHTEIHSFNAHGEEFLSNISNPSIPSALAPVISGISQLDTIRPHPHSVRGRTGTYDAQQKHFVSADNYASVPTPFLTTGSGTSYDLYVVAGDAATIYDTPNGLNANFHTGTSYTGSGVTIGIGGDAVIQGTTVADYRTLFVGDNKQPTISNFTSGPATCTDATSTTCDQDEAYLDNEIAGGLAPGATIHFYTAANLSNAIEQAISDNTVDIFSLSFGECEAAMTTSENQIINDWWQQAAAQGIAVTVSSGDSGSAGCDNDNTETVAKYGLQVSGFASTPYNIAVGGTDFIGLTAGFAGYVNSPSSNSAGNYYRTAITYIPESTWNDSTTTDTTISANVPYVDSSTGKTNIVSGGGGASSCSTNTNTSTVLTNCTSGYAKPSWQRGAGVPSDGVRDLPDISLLAGNGFDAASWLVCTDDTGTVSGVNITANCTAQSNGSFYFFGFGGTSTSTPAFAGILALVQSSIPGTPRLGQIANKTLYDLYNGPHASAVFHDTTVGNISVPCTSGTPNCTKNTAGSYFLTGYNTGTGYDLATGLGSVDASQLITYWSTATGPNTPTISVNLSASTITNTQPLTVTGSVTGSAGTPTGSVTLTSGTYTSPVATLSSSGGYSIAIPASSLNVGTDTLTITYSGDPNYATATATATVTVNGLTPTMTVTPSSTNQAANVALTVAVQVSGSGASPTGTVTLSSGSYSTAAQTLSSGSYTFSLPAGTLGAGTDAINISYSGDTTYSSLTGSATVTLTKATPTVSITSYPTSVGPTTTLLNVGVYVAGGAAAPTGSVTLTDSNGYNGGVCTPVGTQSPTACTYNIPISSIPNGTDTLTASYSGNSVFNAATGTLAVPVHIYTPTMAVIAPATVSTGSTLQMTFTVAGTAGNPTPTGAIGISGLQSYQGAGCTLSNGTCTATFAPGTFNSGTDNISVAYSGDSYYVSISQVVSIVVTKSTPAVTVSPSVTSASANSSITVKATVTGGAAGTPTGYVSLSGPGYPPAEAILSGGTFTFTILPNTLSVGTDTLTVSYLGDNNYSISSSSATVTITQPPIPTVTVTPASSTIDTGQSVAVTVAVTGSGATPTGTVTLTSGSYSSSATTLTSGSATITIPANTLASGTDTLSVSYSGDSVYAAGSGTASVTVMASAFSLSGSTPTAINPGSSASSTITVSSSTNYSGSVALACTLTSSPAGAVDSPTCSVTGSPITLSSSSSSATATVNFSSTAASAVRGGSGVAGLIKTGATTLLAFLVFLGIPARRRAWRAIVGTLVLIAAFSTFSACGGSGSSGGGGGGGNSIPGTTAGTYTFTVTATGTPSVSPAPTATVTLTVN